MDSFGKKLRECREAKTFHKLSFARQTNEQNVLKAPVMFKPMADIESLPNKDKERLLPTNFIKAPKLNAL
jgi:hypothetical protein